MAEMLWPLMRSPSIRSDRCVVCGRSYPLQQHHIVRRGAGILVMHGVEVPKPTITLCGFGNALTDPDGRYLCHGLAHHQMLHFRWVEDESDGLRPLSSRGGGHLEFIRLDEPTRYEDALGMGGWRRVGDVETGA